MSKKVTVKRAISLSSIANVTQANSGHTTRCEEQLDEAIYRCLHSLTKRHEPTKEFKAVFSRGAFLKPNTKAFIQVMHFLFNIYDAREFQKRFYWPIFDKATENAFRTSSVEYVNSLIERGKLVGLTKIKAHVVVLPGGVKFMKFLLCIVRLVLQEEVRKAKGCAEDGSAVLTKKSIAQMIDSHQQWSKAGNQIHVIIKEEATILAKRTDQIKKLIEMILAGSELAKTMSYDKLIQLWSVLISSQFKERQKHQQRTLAIAAEYRKLIDKAETKMKNNELPISFTKEQLQDPLNKAVHQNPDWAPIVQEVFDEQGKLDPFKLILVLEMALPSVEQFFANFCFKNSEVIKYEQTELTKVVVKADSVRQQLDVMQRNLPILDEYLLRDDLHANEDSPEMAKGDDNFAIKNKLFCTPPIVMDFEGHSEDAFAPAAGPAKVSQRLALLNREDVQLMNARMKLLSASLCQTRSPRPQRTQNKLPSEQNHQQSSPNTFAVPLVARKEKLNPLTMLNRIKAQSQKHHTGSKPTSSAPMNNTMNISTLSEISMRPEFSSTLLGTPEKSSIVLPPTEPPKAATEGDKCAGMTNFLQVPAPGSHHQQMVRQLAHSPGVHSSSPRLRAIYVGSTETPKSRRSSANNSLVKRSSLVENVSVHTSPSGRLEPMIKQKDMMPPPPGIIRLSESNKKPEPVLPLHASDTVDTSDEKTLQPENGDQQDDLSNTLLALSLESQATIIPAYQRCKPESISTAEPPGETNKESLSEQEDQLDSEEDNLFNVSDGILTDFD